MQTKTLFILFFISSTIIGCYGNAEIYNKSILSDRSNNKSLHYTWDMNEDGINDCEKDGLCDHTVDYSIPRYKISGVKEGIVFDKRSGKWVDKFGICHTCTPENGFKIDGSL